MNILYMCIILYYVYRSTYIYIHPTMHLNMSVHTCYGILVHFVCSAFSAYRAHLSHRLVQMLLISLGITCILPQLSIKHCICGVAGARRSSIHTDKDPCPYHRETFLRRSYATSFCFHIPCHRLQMCVMSAFFTN